MSITSKEFRAMGEGKKPKKQEESLQIQLAAFMRMQYPKIIFRSDFAAGIKMSMGQAMRHKRMQHGRAYPDFFIAKPRGVHAGLYLELKKSREGVWLKDGSLSTNAHIQEQAEVLRQLENEGYRACFACGYDEAVQLIRDYMDGYDLSPFE